MAEYDNWYVVSHALSVVENLMYRHVTSVASNEHPFTTTNVPHTHSPALLSIQASITRTVAQHHKCPTAIKRKQYSRTLQLPCVQQYL